jgi:hypothetical protein
MQQSIMRKFLLLGFMIFVVASHSIGQHPYHSFVESSSVKWAAYANDTFRFTSLNLNLYLRNQLLKNKIEARLTADDNISQIKVTIDSVEQRISSNRFIRNVDDAGKITEEAVVVTKQLYNSTFFNSFTNNLVDVQQVIYIKDGRLQSHIAWVSPMYDVVTTMGTPLGISNAFNTAFNTKTVFKPRWKKKAISLGTTYKKHLLNPAAADLPLLKPLYGHNLLQALWPSIDQSHFTFQQPTTGNALHKEDLTMFLLDSNRTTIPIYDNEGYIRSYQMVDLKNIPLPLTNIPFVVLEQEWFYHQKKNKLYSTILSIECWGTTNVPPQVGEVAVPFLKILQAK